MRDNGVRHVDVKGGVREIAGKHHEYAEGAQAGTQRGTILQRQGHVQIQITGKCSDKNYREMFRQKYREMFRQKIQGNVSDKKYQVQGNVQTTNTGKCQTKNKGKFSDKNQFKGQDFSRD